jgi:hypothetical protein
VSTDGDLIETLRRLAEQLNQQVIEATQEAAYAQLSREAAAAITTLRRLRYTWEGGSEWKPPLGKPPRWIEAEPPASARDERDYDHG